MISKVIEWFVLNKKFSDKSFNEGAFILTNTILSIMSNFIPKEVVTVHDRDPPWINNKIKSLLKNKTEYFENCIKPNNPESIAYFEQIQNALQKKKKNQSFKYKYCFR